MRNFDNFESCANASLTSTEQFDKDKPIIFESFCKFSQLKSYNHFILGFCIDTMATKEISFGIENVPEYLIPYVELEDAVFDEKTVSTDKIKAIAQKHGSYIHSGKAGGPDSKQSNQYMSQFSQTLKFENNPSKENYQQGIDMFQRSGNLISDYKALQQQKDQIIDSPENIIPAGSVPHTGQKPYHCHVPDNLFLRAAASA